MKIVLDDSDRLYQILARRIRSSAWTLITKVPHEL